MPEGTPLDPRRAGEDQPVQPPTPRLEKALDPDAGYGPLMTPERFQDRWEAFKGEPQQVSGIWILHNEILALQGGRTLLSEDANWAEKFSEKPPEPPKPAFSNPLHVKYQSQNDNLSGTGYRECFSSSCAMIAMHWGKVKSDDEYNSYRAKYGDSTDPSAQVNTLKFLGLTPSYFQDGRTSDLEKEIDEGRPVAVGWLHAGPVSNPSGGGHWTVVIGYDDNHWIHNDPNGVADVVNGGYTNNWNGESVSYTRANWDKRWLLNGEGDGWAMIVMP
jgi:hypothetical protein